MSIRYNIWLFSYQLVCKYHTFVEKVIFLFNYIDFYKNSSIYKTSILQHLILILFYTPQNFKKVTIFFGDTDRLYDIRMHKYSRINNFFAREMSTYNTYVFKNKLKYSAIKKNFFEVSDENDVFILMAINLYLIQSVRYLMFWNRINFTLEYVEYIFDKTSYLLTNENSVNNLIYFLSDDLDYSTKLKIDKKDIFYNKVVFVQKIPATVKPLKLVKPNFAKSLKKYNKLYLKFKNNNFALSFITVFKFFLKKEKYLLEKNFLNFYKILYPIKYKPTDVTQFLYNSNIIAFFLRKNKIFNKGRYSRNRQLYRTGVYWCLWLNIINVFGLYYYFYRFVFNFGYFYLPLLLLILSIFGSRLIKYRFYNPLIVVNEFNLFLNLFYNFFSSIIKNFLKRFVVLMVRLAIYIYRSIIYMFS